MVCDSEVWCDNTDWSNERVEKVFLHAPQVDSDSDNLKLQIHFMTDKHGFYHMFRDHCLTTEDYTEAFMDTEDYTFMLNDVWPKIVSTQLGSRKYSIKERVKDSKLPWSNVIAYKEHILDSEEEMRKKLDLIAKERELSVTAIEERLTLQVMRFTLKPKHQYYTITIDTIESANNLYTVCALKTKCTRSYLTEATKVEVSTAKAKYVTLRPVISKVGFCIQKRLENLFAELQKNKIFLSDYELSELLFSMDVVYDYGLEEGRTYSKEYLETLQVFSVADEY